MSGGLDILILLNLIKELTYHYEFHRHVEHSLYNAQRRFFTVYQGKDSIYQDYLEKFNTTVVVLDQIG